MKLQTWLPILFVLLCTGCADPSELPKDPFKDNSPEGLPHFKLVRVIDGSIVQIGPSNQLVVHGGSGSEWSSSYSGHSYLSFPEPNLPPSNFSSVQLNNQLWIGDHVKQLPSNSYLDSKGAIHQFVADTQSILISDGGKKVVVTPLRVPTQSVQYYTSNLATYVREGRSSLIRKIYDHEGTPRNCVAKDDTLFTYERLPAGGIKIMRLNPTDPPKELFRGPSGMIGGIVNLSSDNKLTFERDWNYTVVDSRGKVTDIDDASFDVTFLNYKGKQFQIGFARSFSPDKTKWVNVISIWNKDGKPVRMSKLCPEFESAMVRIHQMFKGMVVVNDTGMVAIECSGHNLLPGKTDIDYSSNASKVNKTYVFQVIDDK